ncbi:MAG: hypothetical protein ACJAT5_000169 [Lentimonas sp.]|jgi:hypothetical protein
MYPEDWGDRRINFSNKLLIPISQRLENALNSWQFFLFFLVENLPEASQFLNFEEDLNF